MLAPGMSLVYGSGDTVQPAWQYESVNVVDREGFARCVVVTREGMAPRENCSRGDTLFQPGADGVLRAVRPIGPGMPLSVPQASGSTLEYQTFATRAQKVGGVEVAVVATTIVTRNVGGEETRRLREMYAPALLTAAEGTFEEPDGAGGWRPTQSFSLLKIRSPISGSPGPVGLRNPLERAAQGTRATHFEERACGVPVEGGCRGVVTALARDAAIPPPHDLRLGVDRLDIYCGLAGPCTR